MEKKKNTKQLIVEISFDLFSKLGYSATSIRNIASEVGVRESAIYNHFKSKEEILKAIIEEFKGRTSGTEILNDELLDEIDNPPVFMRKFSEQLLKQWSDKAERKFFRLLLMEQFREIKGVDLSISSYYNDTRSVWRMIFNEMVKHKFIRKNDPEILAESFISVLYFIRLEYLTNEKKIDLDKATKLVNKHIEFFWQAIKQN